MPVRHRRNMATPATEIVVHLDQIDQLKGHDSNRRSTVLRTSRHGMGHGLAKGFESTLGGCHVRTILFRRKHAPQIRRRCLLKGKRRTLVLNVPPGKGLVGAARDRFVFDADAPVVAFGTEVVEGVEGGGVSVE